MKFFNFIGTLLLASAGLADRSDRQALAYATLPEGIYAPAVNVNVTTLLEFIQSRSDLSILANLISQCGGK
jgi:hypothetical protein